MDDPKSQAGQPTGQAGMPPPNLPVVSSPVVPPPPKPLVSIASVLPKPPTSFQPAQPIKPSQPVPIPQASLHTPPQPQGDITLPRSSIRTMESDIKSAQAGQVPKGLEIKSSVLSAETKSVTPSELSKPTSSPALPPTGVKLGEAEKRTVSLPGQSIVKPMPKPPETKPASPVISPPAPVPLLKTSPVLPIKPVPPAGIAVPPKPSIFANKIVLAVLALVVLGVIGAVFYLRSGQEPEEIAQPTFTPRASLSPTSEFPSSPVSTTFTKIFPTLFHLAVSTNDPNALDNLKSEAIPVSNKSSTDKNTLVFVKEGSGDFYKFSNFLDRFSISFPANLASSVDNDDFGVILTKQAEFFDESGKMVASPSAEMLLKPKMALAVRVVDATEVQTQLISWEDTIIDSFREFYDLPPQFGDISFSENFYRGVKIRYANFPHADKSIDYTIITAKNGNDYLVIANSREQIFSIVDKLLGF